MHTEQPNERGNVYALWKDFGQLPGGLWLLRDSWSACIARVITCTPLIGDAPYYSSGKPWYDSPRVFADLYYPGGRTRQAGVEITSPGTFSYKRITCPQWWRAGQSDQ